jgi:hypothetical protein
MRGRIRPSVAHSLVMNLKKYVKEAGGEGFHLHRTRHTFARRISTPEHPGGAMKRCTHDPKIESKYLEVKP